MEEEATQPATQPLPGHEGVAPSSINNNYLAGVICLLHPSSPAAYATVERLSKVKPSHVLKFPDISQGQQTPSNKNTPDQLRVSDDEDEEDPPTQIAAPGQVYSEEGLDIALRREPGPKDPQMGFLFGRNPNKCDIVIGETSKTRRISNLHFRIYQNATGVLMLEDYSTNGTWVDSIKLGGNTGAPQAHHSNGNTHALFAGSIICVAPGEEFLRFVIRIPNQSGSGLCPSGPPASSSINEVGIDPGPPLPVPQRIAPHIRPTVPRSPHRNLAAIRRTPAALQGHQIHSSMNVPKDLGWNGGGIYKIEGIIGAGAFATVKRAVLRKTGDVFAIKVIQKRSVASHSTSVRKEVDILEKLNHPNIVGCKEYHEDTQYLYIVMEFVGGGDLNDYLKTHRYMRENQVQEVSRQVLRGIEYVHGMGISHRDLKPDNILMVSEEPLIVKISDFGLAKMVQSEETFLKTFCGTMLYLAPEVYPGYATALLAGANSVKRKRNPREDVGREDGRNDKLKKRYNQAVDMWSFGCVIHTLLTGKPAFEGKNADDMLRIILKGYTNTTVLERTLGRDCDDAKDFITRLLQVSPAMRMHEQEALKHIWLKHGSDISSSSMEQDDGDDEISYENAQRGDNILMSNELGSEDDYHIVDGGVGEKWQKVPSAAVYHWVDSVRKSNSEEPNTPKPEDALLGAVRRMSFDQSGNKMLISDESDESFRSLDAESHDSDSRMFRRPPDLSQGGSSIIPGAGSSILSAESVALPNNGVPFASPQTGEPFQFSSRAEFQFASPAVASSDLRSLRAQGRSVSEGSLAATEAMVGKLKVASPSPRETPSPKANEPNKQQKGNKVEFSNISSFNDPAVVYSTPLSLMAPQGSVPPTPPQKGRRSSNPENHAPLSQPCNTQLQAEVMNFARPNTPWGKLVPTSGSISGATISLNKQMIVIGRSSTCTHVLQDIRVSKTHFAIQLADPELRIQPADDRIWRPQGNMIAWFKVAGTNGCILNGKKKRKGSIGRIFDGDIIHLFKEEKNGQIDFIAYRCELKIGVHRRYELEVSDEDMTMKQKADVAAHGISMGISMATTMAIASPFTRQDESFVDEV